MSLTIHCLVTCCRLTEQPLSQHHPDQACEQVLQLLQQQHPQPEPPQQPQQQKQQGRQQQQQQQQQDAHILQQQHQQHQQAQPHELEQARGAPKPHVAAGWYSHAGQGVRGFSQAGAVPTGELPAEGACAQHTSGALQALRLPWEVHAWSIQGGCLSLLAGFGDDHH
jgi:hypothetical protein